MKESIVNFDSKADNSCIINTNFTIVYDNEMEDYVSAGVHMASKIAVGLQTCISGISVLSNNISICENYMIGGRCC